MLMYSTCKMLLSCWSLGDLRDQSYDRRNLASCCCSVIFFQVSLYVIKES